MQTKLLKSNARTPESRATLVVYGQSCGIRHDDMSDKGLTLKKSLIVVADDAPECLIRLTEIMSREGYDVRQAESGQLALPTEVVIRPDVEMPGSDGLE